MLHPEKINESGGTTIAVENWSIVVITQKSRQYGQSFKWKCIVVFNKHIEK